jgi:hypothetical protein
MIKAVKNSYLQNMMALNLNKPVPNETRVKNFNPRPPFVSQVRWSHFRDRMRGPGHSLAELRAREKQFSGFTL